MGISFFFSLPLASLPFIAICKASSDNHFAFLHFLFLGMVFITAPCTMSRTSVHCSSGTLSDLIPWICLSLPLYNHKGFDLGHIQSLRWTIIPQSFKFPNTARRHRPVRERATSQVRCCCWRPALLLPLWWGVLLWIRVPGLLFSSTISPSPGSACALRTKIDLHTLSYSHLL